MPKPCGPTPKQRPRAKGRNPLRNNGRPSLLLWAWGTSNFFCGGPSHVFGTFLGFPLNLGGAIAVVPLSYYAFGRAAVSPCPHDYCHSPPPAGRRWAARRGGLRRAEARRLLRCRPGGPQSPRVRRGGGEGADGCRRRGSRRRTRVLDFPTDRPPAAAGAGGPDGGRRRRGGAGGPGGRRRPSPTRGWQLPSLPRRGRAEVAAWGNGEGLGGLRRWSGLFPSGPGTFAPRVWRLGAVFGAAAASVAVLAAPSCPSVLYPGAGAGVGGSGSLRAAGTTELLSHPPTRRRSSALLP